MNPDAQKPVTPAVAPKKPTKKAAAKPAHGHAGVSAADWKVVQQVAAQHGIDPYVLVAIGVHETGWGSQGAGRQGYALGVGVPDSGIIQPEHQGLRAQLDGAAQILQKYGVHTIQDLASGVLAPHGGQVRYASDTGWTKGVVAAYNQVKGTKFTAATSSASGAPAQQAGSATAGQNLPNNPGATPPKQKETAAELAADYSYAAAFFNVNPELHALMYGPKGALALQWTPDKFKAALMNTQWYRTHDEAQRVWTGQLSADPTSAHETLNLKIADLQRMAVAAGSTIDTATATTLAQDMLYMGMTDAEATDAINLHLKTVAGQHLAGDAGAVQDHLAAIATDYGIPFTNDQLAAAAVRIQTGQTTVQDFQNQAVEQAKTKYAGFTQLLDGGSTMKQIAGNYVNEMGRTLDINPDTIDWTKDPTIQKALNVPGSKPGEPPQAMPFWQFNQSLRTDPRWQRTDGAKQEAFDTGVGILKSLGLTP